MTAKRGYAPNGGKGQSVALEVIKFLHALRKKLSRVNAAFGNLIGDRIGGIIPVIALALCLSGETEAAITRPANGFLTVTSGGGAVAGLTLNQPTGAITGDLLVVQVGVRGGAVATTITPPAG